MGHFCFSKLGTLGTLIAVLLAAPLARALDPARLEPFMASIKDKDGKAIGASAGANTLLFDSRMGNPVVAPDGHQVTLSEFRSVRGSVGAKCISQGTHTVMRLTGLIPKGIYTVWLFTYGPDGAKGAPLSVGPLGEDPNGNGNIIFADEDGEGDLSATTPAGPMAASGGPPACWLTDVPQAALVGAYHLDSLTHGKAPGPPGTFVEQFAFRFRSLNHVKAFVRDGDGKMLDSSSAKSTLVFESRQGNPVVSTDGHQLTLGEFDAAQGAVSVKCSAAGTRTQIHVNGLVPNGVYTVWLLIFGSDPAAGPIKVGALGADKGASNNVFVADQNGEADVAATNPAGALSATGSITSCWPDSEMEVHVVGVYHLDGDSHGAGPGPAGSFVEQFAFRFAK